MRADLTSTAHLVYPIGRRPFNSSGEHVEPSSTLSSIVGFYFAFRLVFVLLSARVFFRDPQDGVIVSLACDYLLLVLVFLYGIGPHSRTLTSMLQLPSLRWVFLYVAFSGVSLLWSATASLAAAAAFWFAMAADALIVTLLLRDVPVDAHVNSLMRGYIWGSCAIATLAWLLPSQSDLRLGDEELLGPNQIGWVCAFAFFLAQYLMRATGSNWLIPAALLALTTLRSLSKTTIIALVAGQAYILLRDRSMSRTKKCLLGTGALCVVAVFSSLIANYFDVYTNAGTQSETLTGRLGIWSYFISEALDKPWLGHGFHSVWKVVPPFYDGFEARHAHNELLQQFYAYGAVGIFMLGTIYGSVYRQLRQISDSSLKTFFIGMLVFVLVRGLADTEPFDLSLPMWFIVITSAITAQLRNSREVSA